MAWIVVWDVATEGSPIDVDGDVAMELLGFGQVTRDWGLRWDALGWFGSECRRSRGVTKWFEAGGAVLVMVVVNVGNDDGSCTGDGSCAATGCTGRSGLAWALVGSVCV